MLVVRDQSGWSKTETMEEIMAETNRRRRKTRRGKKKPYRRDENGEVLRKSLETDSLFGQTEVKHFLAKERRNVLRPSLSPKAPMNSTQFLIEDSGNDMINFDDFSNMKMNSPDQMIINRSELEEYECASFYEDSEKKCFGDDDEYVPICLDETTKFMGLEFEKEMLTLNYDLDTRFEEKKIEFKRSSKEEIVDKFMQLDIRLRCAEEKKIQREKDALESKMEILLKENSSLQEENKKLRSLLP